jgi:alkanesulfonate monooxygenase SsuD/methylene tetrahydromethanopterin reductase-like flavin-dependent oxidoreductase (luciferase family)
MIGAARLVCGIGRGDSAVRIRRGRPSSLAELEDGVRVVHGLTRGDEVDVRGQAVKLEWARGGRVPVYVAAYGPRALALAARVADGVIIQVADPFFVSWCLGHVGRALDGAGRDPATFRVQVAAPSVVTADRELAREQLRWFPALVANHVADLLRHHEPAAIPEELRTFVDARTQYDYRRHTRQNADHYEYVPDEIVDRFTVHGTAEECARRLRELADLGVTEYNVYTTVPEPERVIETYGREIIPRLTAVAA